MESNVTQRVNELRNKLGLSILAFSREIKINQTTLNKQLKEDGIGVSIDTVVLILQSYPGLSAEWLMRGTGNIMRVENEKQLKEGKLKVTEDNELVEALRDQITSLKETNALLREKITMLETQKKYDAVDRELPVAAEEITYKK